MGRYFDTQAALAEIRDNPIHPIHPIPEADEPKNRTNRTNRVPPVGEKRPDHDAFEERAAIIEFDAGLPPTQAEDLAAQAQGSTVMRSAQPMASPPRLRPGLLPAALVGVGR